MRIRLAAALGTLAILLSLFAPVAEAQEWRLSEGGGWVWDEPGEWHQSANGTWIYCWPQYFYVASEGVNDWRWGWSCATQAPA